MEHLAYHTILCLVLLDSNCDVCKVLPPSCLGATVVDLDLFVGRGREQYVLLSLCYTNFPISECFFARCKLAHDALKELVEINSCKYERRLPPI